MGCCTTFRQDRCPTGEGCPAAALAQVRPSKITHCGQRARAVSSGRLTQKPRLDAQMVTALLILLLMDKIVHTVATLHAVVAVFPQG